MEFLIYFLSIHGLDLSGSKDSPGRDDALRIKNDLFRNIDFVGV